MRRMPSLNALRAFEAAARHESFSRAADELNVTHAAISHQVRGLEARLGVPLFVRHNRAVRLTEAGRGYLPVLREAFDRIAEATEELFAEEAHGPFCVSTTPAFAARWLVPRLGRFLAAHPEIDVHLKPSEALVDFARDDVDLAVRYGQGAWPGLRADRLMPVRFFPACSPALLARGAPLEKPDDLRFHTLIHVMSVGRGEDSWAYWLSVAGVLGLDVTRGLHLHDASLALQAAVDGEGVVLTIAPLAGLELAAGRLVKPFEIALPEAVAYYVVCPEGAADRPKVAVFRDWLLKETEREPASERAVRTDH